MSSERRKILCVDDEPKNLRYYEQMLGSQGYEVITAGNGIEALEKIKSGKIDLVLLDVMMPEMDGYEVCRRLKGDDTTKNIPVIIVTALEGTAARIMGLEAGANDFLTKPVDSTELIVRAKKSPEGQGV